MSGPSSERKSDDSEVRETSAPSSGADLIVAERARQLARWSPDHDDNHDGDLAQAAVVYASPIALYVRGQERTPGRKGDAITQTFYGLWPYGWEFKGTEKMDGSGLSRYDLPDVDRDERIRELAKAGALIAAEIDRLQRA